LVFCEAKVFRRERSECPPLERATRGSLKAGVCLDKTMPARPVNVFLSDQSKASKQKVALQKQISDYD